MALRDRVTKLERTMQPNDGRCRRCRCPHFDFAPLLADVVSSLRDPSGLLAPEPTCRCVCCARDAAEVADALSAIGPAALSRPFDVAALKERLNPYMAVIAELADDLLAQPPTGQTTPEDDESPYDDRGAGPEGAWPQ